MPNYQLIKNIRLRQLLQSSESIKSKPTAKIDQMVAHISELPEKDQAEIIKMLEEEQTKTSPKNSSDKSGQQIATDMIQVQDIDHQFVGNIRKFEESKDQEKASQAADNLLQNLE